MKSDIKNLTQQKIKNSPFNFDQIGKYFVKAAKDKDSQTISDRTYQDLDLEDVFKFIDRTLSCPGQQLLYYVLRTIPKNDARKQKLEGLISVFHKNPDLRASIAAKVAKLNKKDAYYLPGLFQEKYLQRPKWFWLIQTLCCVSVFTVALFFIFPQLVILLMLLLPVNLLCGRDRPGTFHACFEGGLSLLLRAGNECVRQTPRCQGGLPSVDICRRFQRHRPEREISFADRL
ncbi:hypothetical protein [Dyadobacter crusticola]|uniref:hypothetical protein n=1 Tax=Dyadobacter crusticola TaxID=292407 RepID=UPI00068E39A0|nr:hypothetical protein [Dyadobacter crusticola]